MRILPILLILALWSCGDVEQPQSENSNVIAPYGVIEAPFEQVAVDFTELRIDDPSQAVSFTLPGGSRLDVPANAFVHEDGTPVLEPISVRYREFHEAAAIIASGIPMRVKGEDDEEGWLQTAGMFEFRAQSEGRPVQVAEDKSVELDFASRVDGDYDFWAFDEEAGNWDNLGTSAAPKPSGEVNEAATQEIQSLRQRTQRPPINPEVPESYKMAFTDLDVSRTPELRGQETIIVAYAGNDEALMPSNNAWVRTASWLRKTLEPTPTDGVYQLTLSGQQRYAIPVRVVPQGKAMDEAKARYAEQMEAYRANLAALADREAMLAQQQTFRRLVSLQGTGIYNYDILFKLRTALPVMADFNFGNLPEAMKQTVTVYLVTADNRSAISFSPAQWEQFCFLPDQDNMILAVLPNNQVAYFTPDDFKQERDKMIAARGQAYTFQMRIKEQTIRSVEDLQELIEVAL